MYNYMVSSNYFYLIIIIHLHSYIFQVFLSNTNDKSRYKVSSK